jgi:uncharacterized protein
MKNVPFSLGLKTGVGLFLLLFMGCAGNTPSRYYVLNSLPSDKVQGASEESCISVGIGPISLPEYVNRLQIVARTTPNELALSGFDLWAEPLAESVPRILGENISRLVCTKEVSLFPWKPSRAPGYRVEAEILSMDGNLGKAAGLEVWWTISSGGEKTARATRKSKYTAPVAGQNYEALVQAHSQTLAALSRDIAEALKELSKQRQ